MLHATNWHLYVRFVSILLMILSIFLLGQNNYEKSSHKFVQQKYILITLDGVRWQEIFEGSDSTLSHKRKIPARTLFPNMYKYFVDEGIASSKLIASGPAHLSMPGYLEIMRGKRPIDCMSNSCNFRLGDTIADHFESVAVFSSWPKIRQTISEHQEGMVIGCGRDYRSKAWLGLHLIDYSGAAPFLYSPEYRGDEYTAASTLTYLIGNRPDFLWVSFGDTDEWAHLNRYQNYLNSIKFADWFIGNIVSLAPEYTIIITTDHGRAANFVTHNMERASERVWLMARGPEMQSYKSIKALSEIKPMILATK